MLVAACSYLAGESETANVGGGGDVVVQVGGDPKDTTDDNTGGGNPFASEAGGGVDFTENGLGGDPTSDDPNAGGGNRDDNAFEGEDGGGVPAHEDGGKPLTDVELFEENGEGIVPSQAIVILELGDGRQVTIQANPCQVEQPCKLYVDKQEVMEFGGADVAYTSPYGFVVKHTQRGVVLTLTTRQTVVAVERDE